MCRLARPKSSAESYQNIPHLHKQVINTGGSGGRWANGAHFLPFYGDSQTDLFIYWAHMALFTGDYSNHNKVFRFIRFKTINGKIIIENVLFEQVKPSTNILCQFDIY